jgi:hypothetical protein
MDKRLIDFDDEFSITEIPVRFQSFENLHQEEVFHEDPRMNSRQDDVCN